MGIISKVSTKLESVKARAALAITTAATVAALTVVAVPGTMGAFTASTSNPGNNFAAGTLTMTNSKASAAILTMSNMQPGDSQLGTLRITNSGSLAAAMVLNEGSITNNGPAGSGNLAGQLTLLIQDCGTAADAACTATSPTVYSGAFNGVAPNTVLSGAGGAGSKWAAGEGHTYQFTVTLPTAAGNEYQGTSASAAFSWNATAQK